MDELREKIIDIFYKAGLEHLIQSEEQPSGGKFCETCQNLAEPLCYATNAMLVVARQDLLALIASYSREARLDELNLVDAAYHHAIADMEGDPRAVNDMFHHIQGRIKTLKEAKPEGKPNE